MEKRELLSTWRAATPWKELELSALAICTVLPFWILCTLPADILQRHVSLLSCPQGSCLWTFPEIELCILYVFVLPMWDV